MFIAGYLPFAEKDNFRVEGQELSLIGTSERQSLLGMHADEILPKLPIMYLGDSMLPHRGGQLRAGREGHHQSPPVLQARATRLCPPRRRRAPAPAVPGQRGAVHEGPRCAVPGHHLLLADLAAPGSFKYDTEAWLPSQQRYREMTSNTNLTDFQTRRGNIRYKTPDGAQVFPYDLGNGVLRSPYRGNPREPPAARRLGAHPHDRLVPYMDGRVELTPSS